MPRRKKTHTSCTEPPPVRGTNGGRSVRRMLAAEAARIMATEGQRNFRLAKQKAAQRIGVSSRQALPSNREVEEALRAYQDFFGGHQHTHHLSALRAAAVDAMRGLAGFQPRLVGPVLDGTADRYSRISLHVFSDTPEAISIYLLDRGIPFRQEQRRIRWHDRTFRNLPLLVLERDDATIELAVFGVLDLRQAPPCPVDGRPQRRAPLAEVEALLAGY